MINTVFSVPIFESTVDVSLSEDNINYLIMQSFGHKPNSHKAINAFVGYNDNDNILDLDFLKDIKTQIETSLEKFIDEYGINKDYWYIGKSWLTVAGPGGNIDMHNHIHHGGILSGVVYISTPKDCGGLVFINPYPFRDRIPFIKETEINKSFFKVNVEPGKILIWPSSLNHGTEPNQGSGMRISIAFDIFYVNKNYGVPPQEILEKINERS